jgi:hypothetical protein
MPASCAGKKHESEPTRFGNTPRFNRTENCSSSAETASAQRTHWGRNGGRSEACPTTAV